MFIVTGEYGKDYILLLNGKIFIRNVKAKANNLFDEAIDDYYSKTINYNFLPTEEDLEKMKITLNWLIKNRNNARLYYLKEYSSREQLFSNISSVSFPDKFLVEKSFDIRDLVIT